MKQEERIDILLDAIGIDKQSFLRFLEWALSEQIIFVLTKSNKDLLGYFNQKDGLKIFRNFLESKTKRKWSINDLNKLYETIKIRSQKHFRESIEYGEYLKLLWTVEHKCSKCGKSPPDVKLHIDHIIPVSLGGTSKRANLQFLCQECNLRKSDKLEGGEPWLDLL